MPDDLEDAESDAAREAGEEVAAAQISRTLPRHRGGR